MLHVAWRPKKNKRPVMKRHPSEEGPVKLKRPVPMKVQRPVRRGLPSEEGPVRRGRGHRSPLPSGTQ